jgi:two-component system, LytTR family, response regulator
MNRIRTLIVDDEPLARKTLRLLLEKDGEIEILGECRNGAEAVKQISEQSPDLVFLDVQMPHMNGFDVVRTVGVENMPVTVFVTAYDTYALKAFEVEALDYLLKPFEDARFDRALRRAKAAVQHSSAGSLVEHLSSLLEHPEGRRERQKPASRLLISTNGKVVFLKADDIDWIDAVDYYVKIYAHKKTYLQRETMDRLEKTLDPQKFFRIHRSTIVNIERVKELQSSSTGNYVVVLHDGTELRMSRRRRQQFKGVL